MMSELEKDLHYAMCESANISEAEADRILDAIMPTIKPLGYTRPGLTDSQREVVEKSIKLLDTLTDYSGLRDAFPSTPTPPEPPKPDPSETSKFRYDPNLLKSTCSKCNVTATAFNCGADGCPMRLPVQSIEPPKPERKVNGGWLPTTCGDDSIAELCVQGWEPYQVLTIPETLELLYFLKRPIPGDAA